MEFIEDDELIEITPKSIRVRKRHLFDHDRRRASRAEPRADAETPAAETAD